ncbi:hypothetical protein KAH27_01395, partial [bacterium]|nr:hypothetical protein [bacterium]
MEKQITSNSLENKYPKLTDIQKEILQILALITYPFNYNMVLRCFETICDIPDIKLSFIKVKKQFEELIDDGFILQGTFNGIELDYEFSNRLFRTHTVKNSNLKIYREIIAEELTHNSYFHSKFDENFREFRISFLLKETEKVMEFLDSDISIETQKNLFLNSILFTFDPDLFINTPYESFAAGTAVHLCHYKIVNNLPIDDCVSFLLKNIDDEETTDCFSTIAIAYLFQGEFNKLEKFIEKYKAYLPYFPAILSFSKGDINKAQKQFEEAITFQRKIRHNKYYCPEGIAGLFYCFTYLAFAASSERVEESFKRTVNYGLKYNRNTSFYKFIKGIIAFWEDKTGTFEKLIKDSLSSNQILQSGYLSLFIIPLLQQYREKMCIKYDENDLYKNIEKFLDNKFPFLAFQSYKLLVRYFGDHETYQDNYYYKNYADKFEKYNDKFINFASLFVDQPEWKDKLNQLNKIAPARIAKSSSSSGKEKETRISWYVSVGDEDDYHYDDNSRLQFIPQYQTCTKNGKWSKGRTLSLKAFSEGDYAKTELDKKIASCIKRQKFWRRTIYGFNYGKVLRHFYKHPFLFLKDNPEVPFELINEPLQLFVKKTDKNISLSLSHSYDIIAGRSCADYLLLEELPGKAKVLETHGINLKIIELFGDEDTLIFPIESEKELNNTILKLSSKIIVHSDGKNNLEIDSVKADSKIHIHILPVGNGIRAEFFIRPFISEGPYFKPGFGSDVVISGVSGAAKQAKRDL